MGTLSELLPTQDPILITRSKIVKANLLSNIVVMSALTAVGHAQTIDWSSKVRSSLLDSNGTKLSSGGFAFELGAFRGDFVPTGKNVSDWRANWVVFDQAGYSEKNGYFTSTVQMLTNGTSSSPYQTPGAESFEKKQAYVWIHNSDQSAANEWMLARATNWTFPTAITGGSGLVPPLEWSVGDLTPGLVPLWGKQGATQGSGAYSSANATSDLRTSISIFNWTIQDVAPDPGTGATNKGSYNVLSTPSLTGGDAIFKVLLASGGSFSDAFWDTNKRWDNIFSVATGSDLANIFSGGFGGDPLVSSTGGVSGQGSFSFNGSTLNWTAFSGVPEPTNTVVGLLLLGGLLRRHRNTKSA